MSTILVLCWYTWAWLMEWYRVRFTQLLQQFVQLFKSSKLVQMSTRTSGAFLMVRGTERYLFGDCAININPDAEALAEIAINSAITAKMFGIEPKIAMLSYSTKGSGFGESVDKVVEATKIAHDLRPDLEIDGELQFDAAFVPETAALKAPGSTVAGQANVFIFPGIEAGNIGYKMAERLGGFAAVGPVLQGLNKPVNDLSRGCNADDVYKLTPYYSSSSSSSIKRSYTK